MSGIHVSPVRPEHDYTRSSTPWLLDGDAAAGHRTKRRLFHFLAGGGLRAFGRSVRQEEADAKRTRFLIVCGVAAALWLALWIS